MREGYMVELAPRQINTRSVVSFCLHSTSRGVVGEGDYQQVFISIGAESQIS
jgi:hypothetical protein